MAFPIAAMGTMQIDSIRIPAENPANASAPKLFTTDWTSIIPIETVDCWRMEGSAIFAMGRSSSLAKIPSEGPSSLFNSAKRTTKEPTTETPWAISVAHATPATSKEKSATKIQSSTMLNTEEKIRKYKGILDFPRALNMEDNTLYIKRKGNPRKYIFK